MKRYAIIDAENTVKNIIIWDEVSTWAPPDNHIMVNVEDVHCDIGWKHENGVFTNPNPPVEEPVDPSAEPPTQV